MYNIYSTYIYIYEVITSLMIQHSIITLYYIYSWLMVYLPL